MGFFERRRAAAVPNVIVSKRQKRLRENRTGGSKGGDGRKYANLADLRECKMKAGIPFPATLCRPPRDAVRTDAAPASAKRGKGLQKGSRILYAEILQIERKSRPKPRFSPLSTLPGIALRQERNFFQQRNPVFAAQKRIPRRRNAPYGQFPRLIFNTSGAISAQPSRRTDAE